MLNTLFFIKIVEHLNKSGTSNSILFLISLFLHKTLKHSLKRTTITVSSKSGTKRLNLHRTKYYNNNNNNNNNKRV